MLTMLCNDADPGSIVTMLTDPVVWRCWPCCVTVLTDLVVWRCWLTLCDDADPVVWRCWPCCVTMLTLLCDCDDADPVVWLWRCWPCCVTMLTPLCDDADPAVWRCWPQLYNAAADPKDPFHLDFRACTMDWRVESAGSRGEHVSWVSLVLVVVKTSHFTATRLAQKITAV